MLQQYIYSTLFRGLLNIPAAQRTGLQPITDHIWLHCLLVTAFTSVKTYISNDRSKQRSNVDTDPFILLFPKYPWLRTTVTDL